MRWFDKRKYGCCGPCSLFYKIKFRLGGHYKKSIFENLGKLLKHRLFSKGWNRKELLDCVSILENLMLNGICIVVAVTIATLC